MTRGEGAAQWPAGRDRGERHQHERAAFELGVWNDQCARGEAPVAPQGDVEIDHPRPPALASAAAEIALDRLEQAQQLGRFGGGFNERDAIGEVAAGGAMGVVEQDRRRVEQRKVAFEPLDRRRDDLRRAAMAAMAAVGADGDGVEVSWLRARRGPRSQQ